MIILECRRLIVKDLSVITVTHQSGLFIEEQVFSVVGGALRIGVEQIVVDSGSTDGTERVLEGLEGVLARVVVNRENVGFAAANNQGREFAKGRFLLFLNPDMRVQEGSLDVLVERMERDPGVGICSCLLVDALGRPMEMGLPRPLPRVWWEALWLLRLDFFRPKRVLPEGEEVEMVKGAFMLVRRELVERLGFAFDPRYFLMFEDADLCREAKRLGYKVCFYRDVQCVDFNSRSFAVKEGRWIYERFAESMLRYFRKWEPWYKWIWIGMLIRVGLWLRRSM